MTGARRAAALGALLLAWPSLARTQPPRGSWIIEYDRATQSGHAAPVVVHQRARLTLEPAGDSVVGRLALLLEGSERPPAPRTVHGVVQAGGLSLRVGQSVRDGASSASDKWASLMDELRFLFHGRSPSVVRFDLVVQGEEIRGTRWVSSAEDGTVTASSAVTGVRDRRR